MQVHGGRTAAHRSRLVALALSLTIALAVGVAACAPAPVAGSLTPTLTIDDIGTARVAMQNGMPVPTFDRQPGRERSLDGQWRFQPTELDSDLSLTDRSVALEQIEAEGAGRHLAEFDDAGWPTLSVPGSMNPPPDGEEGGGWYRRTFSVPPRWEGSAATLKFGAVNYLADVWLNGTWVGYHEGGYTPFAFDVSSLLVPGRPNVIAVRVDNPEWGTRNDIVPWGLADWWNYGGITRSVWLERTAAFHVVRADVVPHLDGIEATATVRRAPAVIGAPPPGDADPVTPAVPPVGKLRGAVARAAAVRFELFPAEVTPANVAEPDARALVPNDARPLASAEVELEEDASGIGLVSAAFLLGGADLWTPERPALYVLRASIATDVADDDLALWTSFGLRRVSVEPETGRLLLNGTPTMLNGVALHDEVLDPSPVEAEVGGRRITEVAEIQAQLEQARSVDADLIRSGHTPANPLLLRLADRLGFAVWEEIPLYHYTPLTFGIAMARGIPQQMLAEMALRDMNHPSVLFHGLANESTGTEERLEALAVLHEVDRAIDGTRLTGQAAYGSQPSDPTHAPLDVAGFTLYHGVFYGDDAAAGTARAIEVARETNPGKPILALEFGRWADVEADRPIQRRIFEETFAEFQRRSASRADGVVGAAVWWTLHDYATMRPGILIEHFGLFDRDGAPRPAAEAAARAFTGGGGEGAEQMLKSDVRRADAVTSPPSGFPRLLLLLGYGLLVSGAFVAIALGVLLRFGGRSVAPRRVPPHVAPPGSVAPRRVAPRR